MASRSALRLRERLTNSSIAPIASAAKSITIIISISAAPFLLSQVRQ